MFLLNSGSYAQGFAFRNMELDDFDDPSGGFAYAFAPGATIKRSPYVRDSSQLSNYNPSAIAAPLDPANANPAVGKGAGMILLIDEYLIQILFGHTYLRSVLHHVVQTALVIVLETALALTEFHL